MTRVVVVDDEIDIQQVIAEVLRDEGYEVAAFGSGRDALEYIRQNPPALVLLDVMMPVMSGLEVLRQLRGSDETRDVPVVMMSAAQRESVASGASSPGWQAFLNKPFMLEALLDTVSRFAGAPEGA